MKRMTEREDVIAAERASEQLENIIVMTLSSFDEVKDLLGFMSLDDLGLSNFETKTTVEKKVLLKPANMKEMDDEIEWEPDIQSSSQRSFTVSKSKTEDNSKH